MVETVRSRITAVLARGPGEPQGDTRSGIELEANLGPLGQIEATGADIGAGWPVRRFWRERNDWHGLLVPVEDGWAVRSRTEGDDEPVWDLEARLLRPGEYLTLRGPDGTEYVFRVVNVEATVPGAYFS